MTKAKNEWVSGTEATEIISRNNERPIDPSYVRLRAYQGKIRSRMKDGRTREYFKPDVEAYQVRQNQKSSQVQKENA